MSLPEESVAANTLPEVTTIPTGKKLIFTDPDTNEGGIITLENLTKQILQNLTSQTFTLDQGNLTLLQALNQLNSKVKTLNYIYCRVKTKVGITAINEDTFVEGDLPKDVNYIPVIISQSKTVNASNQLFYDGGKWHVLSDKEQEISIRFYRTSN